MVYHLIRREENLKEYYSSALSTFTWKEGSCLHKEEQEFLEKMTEVIEKNLANPDLQVELLSKEMGYSSRQFYRKLKPLTDKSPADIIKEYRLSTAERLLPDSARERSRILFTDMSAVSLDEKNAESTKRIISIIS